MTQWVLTVTFDDADAPVGEVESAVLNIFGDRGTAPEDWSVEPTPAGPRGEEQ